MTLNGLLDALAAEPALAHMRDVASASTSGSAPPIDIAAPPARRPFVVATLASAPPRGAGRPVLAVAATGREAEDLVTQLGSFLPEHAVAEYPAWETLPHERLSPRADTVGRRLAVLRRLRHPNPD